MARLTDKKTRILIVDDSASVRRVLTEMLSSDDGLEVMAAARDAFEAAEFIRQEIPDVIFLDIEMPRMDGITFLKRLMSQKPIPVVICSGLADSQSKVAVEALEAGAIDVTAKPLMDTAESRENSRAQLCRAAHAAAHAKLGGRHKSAPAPMAIEVKNKADIVIPPLGEERLSRLAQTMPKTEPVICIGASTGGTEAIREVLVALPHDCPGVVIVQHMPEKFTLAFANRLNGLCRIAVKEAEDGDQVLPGRALIAPGGRHLKLVRRGKTYFVEILDAPPVTRHRPSVDVLFRSASQAAGPNAIGVLLTGMGDDGANGLLEMRQAGSLTIAQDEASCIVFGMPKEAIARGAASIVLPLKEVAGALSLTGHDTKRAMR